MIANFKQNQSIILFSSIFLVFPKILKFQVPTPTPCVCALNNNYYKVFPKFSPCDILLILTEAATQRVCVPRIGLLLLSFSRQAR